MKLPRRLRERRQRKAHERYLRDRERQQELAGQDAEEAVHDVARGSAAAQQGMFGHGT